MLSSKSSKEVILNCGVDTRQIYKLKSREEIPKNLDFLHLKFSESVSNRDFTLSSTVELLQSVHILYYLVRHAQ